MIIKEKIIRNTQISYKIRCPKEEDASDLSRIRVEIDGQTEYLDREPGEAYLSEEDFMALIRNDLLDERTLFLVAEVDDHIVGFARCVGKKLNRFKHQSEFGICILKDYWGYGIGKEILGLIIDWSDEIGTEKINLKVVETNTKAIKLYKKYGFREEGILRRDRIHNDGKYYDTILMARFRV